MFFFQQSFLDDYLPQKGAGFSSAGEVEEYQQNVMEDCKPVLLSFISLTFSICILFNLMT